MSVADHGSQQCLLCVNSYADMHSMSLTNSVFSLKSALFINSVDVWIEHDSCRCCSHDQRCKRGGRFSLGLHASSNTLTASLSFCHVDFQVKIDMWSRGDTLHHTLPYKLPYGSQRHQFFTRY